MALLTAVSLVCFLFLSTVSACPSPLCICEQNNNNLIINCRNRNLKLVPPWQPDERDYAELSLGRNQITTLPANAFSGLKIQKLDLSQNKITSIDSNAFQGINDRLTELWLHVQTYNQLPTEALRKLTNLQKLTLRNFNIQSLPSNAFSYMVNLKVLVLEECGLTSVLPSHLSGIEDTLETLTLSGNQLQAVPSLQLQNLKILNITNNGGFQTLQQNSFQALTKLEHLDLSGNGIATLPSGAFKGLGTLQELNFHRNALVDNQIDFITGLPSLRILDLSFNNLQNIPTELLMNSINLNEVYLQGNDIAKIFSSSFDLPNNNIHLLDLSENSIAEIDDRSFGKLDKIKELNLGRLGTASVFNMDTLKGIERTLRTLHLQGNQLGNSHWGVFNYLSQLHNLYIKENKFTDIPDGTFEQMSNLEILDLNSNQLSLLNHQKTAGLAGSLKALDVSNNRITTISECTFYQFKELVDIKLAQNPLHCDCKLQPLHSWMMNTYDQTIRQSLAWECATPSNLNQRKFKDLKTEDLVCSSGYVAPNCESVVPTVPSITGTPDPSLSQFHITNLTVSDKTVTISWTAPDSKQIKGFHVNIQSTSRENINMQKVDLPSSARSYTATGLEPETEYIIGVTMLVDETLGSKSQTHQRNVHTESPKTQPIVEDHTTRNIILGVVFGVLGVILIIVAICLCRCFCCDCEKDDPDNPYARPGQFRRKQKYTSNSLPTVGNNSQRFSRSKTASLATLPSATSMERVDAFTPEERDRIINMLTHSGTTTISMISTASSDGPDLPPRPPHLQEAYMNAKNMGGGHIYEEIKIGSNV